MSYYYFVCAQTYTAENQYGRQKTKTVTIEVNRLEICGDLYTEGWEECDDGANIDRDGCTAGCIIEAPCPEPDIVDKINDGYTEIFIPVLDNDECGNPLTILSTTTPIIVGYGEVPNVIVEFDNDTGEIRFDPRRIATSGEYPLGEFLVVVVFCTRVGGWGSGLCFCA